MSAASDIRQQSKNELDEVETDFDREINEELGLDDLEPEEEPDPETGEDAEPRDAEEPEQTTEKVEVPGGETPPDDEEEKPLAASGEELTPELREKLKQKSIELRRLKREAEARKAAEPKEEAPPKPTIGPGITIDETGERVGLNPDEFAAGVRDQVSPIQAQLDQMRTMNTRREFVMQDPAHIQERQQVMTDADNAYDYVMAQIDSAAATAGVPIQSVGQANAYLEATGAADELRQAFPALAPLLGEFVGAALTNDSTWQMSLLERAAGGLTAPQQGQPPRVAGLPPKPLHPVTGAPKSLARKGGGRGPDEGTDMKELKRLEAKIVDPETMFEVTDSEMSRYRVLKKQLGLD